MPIVIDGGTVEKLSALMKLHIPPEEEESLRQSLEGILRLAEGMQALDLRDVPPTRHLFPREDALRPDETAPSLPREALLINAPARREDMICVPRAFGQEE